MYNIEELMNTEASTTDGRPALVFSPTTTAVFVDIIVPQQIQVPIRTGRHYTTLAELNFGTQVVPHNHPSPPVPGVQNLVANAVPPPPPPPSPPPDDGTAVGTMVEELDIYPNQHIDVFGQGEPP